MSKKESLNRIDTIVLWASVIVFCIVSLVIYYYTPALKAHFEGDSVRYHFIAHNICGLTNIPLEVLGYPCFLGLLYWLYDSLLIVILAQIILSVLSLFVLRHIIKQLGMDAAALIIASCFWVFNLGFLIYTQLLLIEIMLAFLLLLFVDRVIVYYKTVRLWYCAQAAFILGISILFRPAALFYALFFVVLLFFMTNVSLLKRAKAAGVFWVVFYIPIICYMTLNYYYFGQFVICPVMNVNLFAFYYPKIHAYFQAHGLVSNDTMRAIEYDIAQKQITAVTQHNLLKLFVQHPVITLGIWFQNMVKSCLGLYQTQWKLYFELADKATSYFCLPGSWLSCLGEYIRTGTTRSWLCVLGWYELAYLLVEYLMMATGVLVLLLKRNYWLCCFAVSFIVYFAFITGPDGSGRFRMMMEPWLLVLAVIGFTWLISRQNKKILV